MRRLALVGFGFLLLTVSGALCRALHLEWLRFDPVLVISVFIGMYCGSLPGVFMVFGLGMLSDSFASTPPGMHANGYLVVWLVVWWSKQVFVFKQRSAQLVLVFVMSLVSQLVVLVHLTVMDVGGGPIWVWTKSMFPIAMINALLAMPIWTLALKIHPPEVADHTSILLSR